MNTSKLTAYSILFFAFFGFCNIHIKAQVSFEVAKIPWEPAERGSHRAVVRVEGRTDAVWAHIPWRRRDISPEKKNLMVFDATTGKQIENRLVVEVNQEYGDIIFQPATIPGDYYIYYLPYHLEGWVYNGNYRYDPPKETAEQAWIEQQSLSQEELKKKSWKQLPRADLKKIQSRTDFDRCFPMEVIATSEETSKLLAKYPDRSYLIFPEDRQHEIRMFEQIPLKWFQQGPIHQFEGKVQPGEYYVFQIGIWAARQSINDIELSFSDLKSNDGITIPSSELTCINLTGTDWLGRSMEKVFRVGKGKIRPLWIGVQIPQDAKGIYQGTIEINPQSMESRTIHVKIETDGAVLKDSGDTDLWRLSRLRWLNSIRALDDKVIPPYIPLQVKENSVRCLGRKVTFTHSGLPESIQTHFNNSEMHPDEIHEILAGPIELRVETSDGFENPKALNNETIRDEKGLLERLYASESENFSWKIFTQMEFDGYLAFRVILEPKRSVQIKDVSLEVPFNREIATYMMGLGKRGGYRPEEWQWKWNIERADNMVWLGNPDAGLQLKLMNLDEENYWQMDHLKESGLPEFWYNDGKGGVKISENSTNVRLQAYSGSCNLTDREKLEFRFRFLITPFKPVDKQHWNWRGGDPDQEKGANIQHIHHGNLLNPYINYPFLTIDTLAKTMNQVRSYIQKTGSHNGGINIYYTVRELSNRVAEMWPLRSLGDEVLSSTGHPPGEMADFQKVDIYWDANVAKNYPRGGHPWLQEHLVSGYVRRWNDPIDNGEVDASIPTTGLSRWHNYYVEGMAWLMNHTGIDGLYLDGIGYNREIMKRIAKVMFRSNDYYRINFHGGNTFDAPWGPGKISTLSTYMEHLPYMSWLWIGEGFDYAREHDYWLVEISGIPFGLTGEMLNYETGGNPWRGMLYGMSSRQHPSRYDMWNFWDEFEIQDARMIGYWDESCPVKTDHKDVLATVYKKQEKTLIALASWAKNRVFVNLDINWETLGISSQKATLIAPSISHFQESAQQFSINQPIPVEEGQGWLLVLSEK